MVKRKNFKGIWRYEKLIQEKTSLHFVTWNEEPEGDVSPNEEGMWSTKGGFDEPPALTAIWDGRITIFPLLEKSMTDPTGYSRELMSFHFTEDLKVNNAVIDVWFDITNCLLCVQNGIYRQKPIGYSVPIFGSTYYKIDQFAICKEWNGIGNCLILYCYSKKQNLPQVQVVRIQKSGVWIDIFSTKVEERLKEYDKISVDLDLSE